MSALQKLAEQLRDQATAELARQVIADVSGPEGLGDLVGAGPRAAADPPGYALLVETVREGYLMHYGRPRVIAGHDPDLALLAGDYLYALGLERLAALGDLTSIAELSDLISLSAQMNSQGHGSTAEALWLACGVAIAVGSTSAHQAAKAAARTAEPDAEEALLSSARDAAAGAGLTSAFDLAAEAIQFPPAGLTHGRP